VDDLVEALDAPGEPEVAASVAVVDASPSGLDPLRLRAAVDRLALLPCVVVAAPGAAWSEELAELTDAACADDGELADITAATEATPLAAMALALHLRAAVRRSTVDGLVEESALYSALQAGPEHRAWRSATPARRHDEVGSARVRVERAGSELRVTLCRPGVRNALDVRMRDELLAALAIAEADPELGVVLRGEGPCFCAGGDLDEFGTAPDPATAHLIRLRRSIGAVLHRLAARTTVELHGGCAGSGVELAAFAGRVVAHPDTTLTLPELGLGLVPGAGGTVSIPRRVGRHRTAWLALTRRPITAGIARSWGLVDEITLF